MNSPHFQESQARQFTESRARQRNAVGSDDGEPPDWTDPWARQAVGYVLYSGWAPFDVGSRKSGSDNPFGSFVTDDWVNGIWASLTSMFTLPWGGTGPINLDYRSFDLNTGEWSWPWTTHHRYHIQRWRAECVCTDSRYPVDAWFERVLRKHKYSDEIVEYTLKSSDNSNIYSYALTDAGVLTETGTTAYSIVEWLTDLFTFYNYDPYERSADSTSGESVTCTTQYYFSYWDPPLPVTITLTITLEEPTDADQGWIGGSWGIHQAAGNLCGLIELKNTSKTYDIKDDDGTLIETRAMLDNECFVVRKQGPADGVALFNQIIPMSLNNNFVYPDTPTTTSLTPANLIDNWFPVAENWIDGCTKDTQGYMYYGATYAGLLPGHYRRRHSDGVIPRPSQTESPDNGISSGKGTTQDSDFDVMSKSNKYWEPAAGAADSITYLSDI